MLYNPLIPAIEEFQGQYRFLSNFWRVVVTFDGMTFRSVEHAFQAAKTHDRAHRLAIQACIKPGEAKRKGRMVTLRPDWEKVKLEVMLGLIREKFSYPSLWDKLLTTGEAELVEGNDWGDTFYGRCGGTGQNHLGKMLMRVRNELRAPLPSNVQDTDDIPYGDGYGSGE
jgi:ribA/ribD-fused uncharacterized protein